MNSPDVTKPTAYDIKLTCGCVIENMILTLPEVTPQSQVYCVKHERQTSIVSIHSHAPR